MADICPILVWLVQWLRGRALDLRPLGGGFDSRRGQLRSKLWQVVHTYNVCASVTKQYNVLPVKGCSSAEKVTAGLAKTNGSLPPGMTACTPGSSSGPTLGNECGRTSPLPWVLAAATTHRIDRVHVMLNVNRFWQFRLSDDHMEIQLGC